MDFNNSLYFEMSAESFASLNVPLSVISILMNIFFIYCMVSPHQEAEQLKEPLKVLLGLLVGCNMTVHFCMLLLALFDLVLYWLIYDFNISFAISDMCLIVLTYVMMTSVTSCHWKNMFYFCQIVSSQHSFLIWFKRNLKAIVYSALVLNSILFLFGLIVDFYYEIASLNIYSINSNLTKEKNNKLWNTLQVNRSMRLIDFWTRSFSFILSVFVMLASSSATVLYLWRHMKNVEESGIFSPRLQRQIKVTITGITVQALLHFFCSKGILILEFVDKYSYMIVDCNGYIFCTFICIYSSGTTFIMAVGQSLFRQRIVHVWQKFL